MLVSMENRVSLTKIQSMLLGTDLEVTVSFSMERNK